MSSNTTVELPDDLYEECVRLLLRCPASNTHISMRHLRAMVDDTCGEDVFRAAVTAAYAAGIASVWEPRPDQTEAD